ncbi:cuticle collagen 40-like [Portunus trituberculatus]|uniref:cuticle collagen 40-like n=1 Tax=Portunus trituberculatus TaxID=210409 RepID=UPI001E1D20EE|nr:cuticle collagen 40-like [Portunus trituberculatus]
MPGRRRDCLLPGNGPGGPPGRAEDDEQGGGEPRRPVPLPCQGAGCPQGAGGCPTLFCNGKRVGSPESPQKAQAKPVPKAGQKAGPEEVGQVGPNPGQEAGPAEADQVGVSPGQEAGPAEADQVGSAWAGGRPRRG